MISQRAHQSEGFAIQVIRDGAQIWARVLGPLVAVLDPEILLIGGGVPNIGDLWWQPFEQALRDSQLPVLAAVKISPAHPSALMLLLSARGPSPSTEWNMSD